MGISRDEQSAYDRQMGFRGNLRDWRTVSKDDAVGGVVKLGPGDVNVTAIIPLADADSYEVELPSASEAFERDFLIVGRRATGSYSDGQVQVTAPAGVQYTLTVDPLTANTHRQAFQNVRGKYYRVIEDVS